MRCLFKSHYRDYKLNEHKIDDSEGICGSESDYDSCWNRICNPDRSRMVKDLLRGLLVLIVLAIVVTVVFLLCYFLITDIKEEKKIDKLIDIFSGEIEDERSESSFQKDVAIKTTTEFDIPDVLASSPPSAGIPLPRPDLFNHDDYVEKVPVDLNYDTAYESDFLHSTEIILNENANICEPLQLPMCSRMPWNLAAMPNWVNNNDINELHISAHYFESTIIRAGCSSMALQYSCAILEPVCGPDGIALPPCKTFCEDIVRSCGQFLVNDNKHNDAFQCNRFPDSTDPNTCNMITSGGLSARTNQGSVASEPERDITAVIPTQKSTTPVEEPKVSETIVPITTEKIATTTIEVILEDETTTQAVYICENTQFLCNDGSDCLPHESVCDGVQHCLDHSDEANCTEAISKPEIASTFVPIVPLTKTREVVVKTSPRRPTLSEMLSNRFHVSGTAPLNESSTTTTGQKLKFSPTVISRSVDSTSVQSRTNSLIITTKPKDQNNEQQQQSSSKLSLASLLSTSITPSSPRSIGAHSETHVTSIGRALPILTHRLPHESKSINPRRKGTLSDLLSTAALHTSHSTRVTIVECPELKCIDGKCISLAQLRDGVRDCSDGSDEFEIEQTR